MECPELQVRDPAHEPPNPLCMKLAKSAWRRWIGFLLVALTCFAPEEGTLSFDSWPERRLGSAGFTPPLVWELATLALQPASGLDHL